LWSIYNPATKHLAAFPSEHLSLFGFLLDTQQNFVDSIHLEYEPLNEDKLSEVVYTHDTLRMAYIRMEELNKLAEYKKLTNRKTFRLTFSNEVKNILMKKVQHTNATF